MHVSGFLSTASLLASASATISLTYNTVYDNHSRPLSELACWKKDIKAVLPGYEWEVLGNIPRIMAIDTITGPDSPSCATCWILECGEIARPALALDSADSGILLSLEGMNSLTGGRAEKLGRIDANYTQVALINCGIAEDPVEEL
ncbi:Fc.00g052230.m01.CDS01 [Cosmosporella sp. VM-42]